MTWGLSSIGVRVNPPRVPNVSGIVGFWVNPNPLSLDVLSRRVPLMTWGLSSIGVAYCAIGVASTLPHLVGARLLSGFGVSALVAGAMTAVTDISSKYIFFYKWLIEEVYFVL